MRQGQLQKYYGEYIEKSPKMSSGKRIYVAGTTTIYYKKKTVPHST